MKKGDKNEHNNIDTAGLKPYGDTVSRPRLKRPNTQVCIQIPSDVLDALHQQGIFDLSARAVPFWESLVTQKEQSEATLELRKCLAGIEAQPSGQRLIERFILTADADAEAEIIRRIKEDSGIETTSTTVSPLITTLFRGKVYG